MSYHTTAAIFAFHKILVWSPITLICKASSLTNCASTIMLIKRGKFFFMIRIKSMFSMCLFLREIKLTYVSNLHLSLFRLYLFRSFTKKHMSLTVTNASIHLNLT